MTNEHKHGPARGEGPAEKLLLRGAASLGDVEIIAILLGVGCRGMGVMQAASVFYNHIGGLRGLRSPSVHEFMKLGGIGKMKAARLAAAVEIGRRVMGARADSGQPIRSSADIHTRFAPLLAPSEKEIFMVLGLDSKNKVIIEHRAAEGCLNECPISPREVFGPLLKCPAAATILIHNHPSGDPSPSSEDRLLTVRMCEAGRLLGIKVLDHIILGESRYFSFRDDGMLS
jgi:DNA repair protein RadC